MTASDVRLSALEKRVGSAREDLDAAKVLRDGPGIADAEKRLRDNEAAAAATADDLRRAQDGAVSRERLRTAEADIDHIRADLDSRVADLANVTGQRWGGMLVAGTFLREFVPDGLAWARLSGVDGATVGLWCDRSYSILQLYTADTLAPDRRRCGLAAEPMTCPANALQTGEGIVRLEPGETRVSRWGVRLS